MTKQQTPGALFGYPGQPIHHVLADGRELPAGELVARAVADYGELNPGLAEFQLAPAWNSLTDAVRQQFCLDTLDAINLEQQETADAIDQANLLGAVGETASQQLGGALIDAALTEVKALARPWQQMTEDQQRDVLERITRQVRDAVADTIRLLATQGRTHIVCELEQITVKKGAKAVLEIDKGDLDQDLLDAVGCSVILVVGGPLDAAKDIQAPKPDPSQRDLLDKAHLGNGDSGLVQHSDLED